MADQDAADAQRVIESYLAIILEFTNDPDDPVTTSIDFGNLCNMLRKERLDEFRAYATMMINRPTNNFNVEPKRPGMSDGDPARKAYVVQLFTCLENIVTANTDCAPPTIVNPSLSG